MLHLNGHLGVLAISFSLVFSNQFVVAVEVVSDGSIHLVPRHRDITFVHIGDMDFGSDVRNCYPIGSRQSHAILIHRRHLDLEAIFHSGSVGIGLNRNPLKAIYTEMIRFGITIPSHCDFVTIEGIVETIHGSANILCHANGFRIAAIDGMCCHTEGILAHNWVE